MDVVMCLEKMTSPPSQSVDAFLESSQTICALSYDRLDVQSIISSVHDEAAGATAIFIGLYLHFIQQLH